MSCRLVTYKHVWLRPSSSVVCYSGAWKPVSVPIAISPSRELNTRGSIIKNWAGSSLERD